MRRYIFLSVLFFFFSAQVLSAAEDKGFETTTKKLAKSKGCLSCHDGIEEIPSWHIVPELKGKRGRDCIGCHQGNPDAVTKIEAHKGMYANPSDLRVVEKTCGQCHAGKDSVKVRGETHHVDRVLISPMANNPGGIAGALFSNDFTDDRFINYTLSLKGVKDEKGNELKPLPPSEAHLSIEMEMKFCLKCHLWAAGDKKPLFYRSSGCAACHMPTADDATYQGGDPTVKGKIGYSKIHAITVKVPSSQCVRCHKGGNRIGVSYTGELKGYVPDVHYEKGMHCIDCHLSKEIMGDGNIHIKKWQAVEIRCESCHGTPDSPPTMKGARGTPIPNLEKDGDKYILTSKYDGVKHIVPTLNFLKEKNLMPVQMAIPQHIEKLECYACHAVKQVNCYGCHFEIDRTKTGKDLLTGEESPGAWKMAENFATKWKDTVLGINQKRKVAPFQLGCAVNFTEIDKDGKKIKDFFAFDKNGITSYVRASAQPHTIQRRGMRGCSDCHNSSYTMGLGSSEAEKYPSGRQFLRDPDKMLDEKGNPQLVFSHANQSSLDEETVKDMKKVGECVRCHEKEKVEFWLKFDENYKWVEQNKDAHRAKYEER